MANKEQKISLFSFTLIIMTTVFGFPNTAIAFDQMGYASIIWYILAAIGFFLPTAFMFAEYGSAIKNDHGGVFTWLENSIGTKWAFIGSFIWLCEWILILVNSAPRIWVSASTLILGHDITNQITFGPLTNNESTAILSVLLILGMTLIATRGIRSVTLIASIGGFFITLLAFLFCGFSLFLMFANHGHLLQPVHGLQSFWVSPNPQFKNNMAIMSFMVYAVYAYGGIEVSGGLIDKIKFPGKNFPRGIIIAAIITATLYVISIFLFGFSVNWQQVMGTQNVNLQNIIFVLLYNLGTTIGHTLQLSNPQTINLGLLFARFCGFSILIGTIGTVAINIYAPLKAFILGTPDRLWPKSVTKINRQGMPANAMWIQALFISIILIFLAFGGDNAQQFYAILTDMLNVSNACPYIFLVFAFPFFKKQTDLERPFVFYHSKKVMLTVVTIVLALLSLSIILNLVQPLSEGDYKTAFWTFIGPIFFGGLAWSLYHNAQNANNR